MCLAALARQVELECTQVRGSPGMLYWGYPGRVAGAKTVVVGGVLELTRTHCHCLGGTTGSRAGIAWKCPKVLLQWCLDGRAGAGVGLGRVD